MLVWIVRTEKPKRGTTQQLRSGVSDSTKNRFNDYHSGSFSIEITARLVEPSESLFFHYFIYLMITSNKK